MVADGMEDHHPIGIDSSMKSVKFQFTPSFSIHFHILFFASGYIRLIVGGSEDINDDFGFHIHSIIILFSLLFFLHNGKIAVIRFEGPFSSWKFLLFFYRCFLSRGSFNC